MLNVIGIIYSARHSICSLLLVFLYLFLRYVLISDFGTMLPGGL